MAGIEAHCSPYLTSDLFLVVTKVKNRIYAYINVHVKDKYSKSNHSAKTKSTIICIDLNLYL